MKITFKSFFVIFGIAFLCSNCQSDDAQETHVHEAPITAIPVSENQVQYIEITTEKEGELLQEQVMFEYDSKNRVQAIKNLHKENLEYEYFEDHFVVRATHLVTGVLNTFTFYTDKETGRALSLKSRFQEFKNDDDSGYTFEYNSENKLKSIQFVGKQFVDKETVVWSEDASYPQGILSDNGDLLPRFKNSFYANNASLDLNALVSIYPNFIDPKYAVYNGTLGEKSKYVVTDIDSSLFSYDVAFSANTKGYLEHIRIKKINKKEHTVELRTFVIHYTK